MTVRADVHGRTQWAMRGDYSKSIRQAWEDGVEVEVDNYHYERARLDPCSNTILLVEDNTVHTVINAYDTVDYGFNIPVVCVECGNHHHNPSSCPNCGSGKWMARG